MVIYCDLDEVIADFTGAALAVHGWTRERLEASRPAGTWNIDTAMELTADEFWEPIHAAGSKFWVDIMPLPWAKHVIHLLNKHKYGLGIEWFIVTSPSRDISCHLGKLEWAHKYFGRADHCLVWKHKDHLAAPGRILIDDNEENVRKFVEAGGEGITFPSMGNRLYHLADDPIPYLKKQLEALCTSSLLA